MRIGVIMIFLLCIFVAIYPTMSWGGPLSELTNAADPKIMGIDSIKAAIESRVGRGRNPQYVSRSRKAQHLPRQASQNKKPSLIEMLSDEVDKVKVVQMKRNSDMELKPSLPGQYVSAEYFPVSPGMTWAYTVSDVGTSNVKALREVATVRGAETNIALNEKTGVSICYTSDNDGIQIHRQLFPKVYIQGVNVVDVVITFITPIRLADGIVGVGQTAYSIGTAQYTLMPQRRVIDLDYTATYTLQTHKEVVVPAGSFNSLLFKGILTISGDFESETLYLSKGIGLVKDVVKSSGEKRLMELNTTNAKP